MPEALWTPESDEDWRIVLGGIKTIITVLDEHFIILNQFNAEHTPLAIGIGQPFFRCMEQIPHLMQHALQQTLDLDEPQVLETLYPGDSSRLYRHEMRKVTTQQGQRMIVVSSTEATESSKYRDRTITQTRSTDNPFKLLVDIMPAIVIWIDMNETYLYVNKYVANRTGIPQEEFTGRAITEITQTESSLAQWRGQIADVLQARQPITVEYTYMWKGVIGHNLITVVPVFDESGAITSIFSHSVELAKIHEREEALKQAKVQAENAAQAKDRLIANISHELRTPLNIILGFARLLADDQSLTSKSQDYLDNILNSAQYLTSLVHDLLDASRMELQQFRLEESTVDLHQLIRRIWRTQSERARIKGITLTVHIHSDVPVWIRADETRLRQIAINLLDNAIKFTDLGVIELKLAYAKDPDRLTLEVLDTGSGISETMLESIFDAFVTDKWSKKAAGIGLGLYITRSLVQLMRGTISAENRPEGGTIFRVLLPLRLAAPEDRVAPTPAEIPVRVAGTVDKYRVMVIDDVVANTTLMKEQLTKWGFWVDVENDSSAALAHINEWQPQIILLDLYLSGIDGFTLSEQIRKEALSSKTIIIAVTASAVPADHERARNAGCDAVMTKPLSLGLLADTLAALLSIEFEYGTDKLGSATGHADEYLRVSVTDLQVLPPAWLQRMYIAAAAAISSEALILIDEIVQEHPATAAALRQMIETFNISRIADLIETILNQGGQSISD